MSRQLYVRVKDGGSRNRGGRRFSAAWSLVDLDELQPDQLKAIQDDPGLEKSAVEPGSVSAERAAHAATKQDLAAQLAEKGRIIAALERDLGHAREIAARASAGGLSEEQARAIRAEVERDAAAAFTALKEDHAASLDALRGAHAAEIQGVRDELAKAQAQAKAKGGSGKGAAADDKAEKPKEG